MIKACETQTPTSANSLNKCLYLLENTTYTNASNTACTYALYDNYYINTRKLDEGKDLVTTGVRPVIDIPKSNISY